MYMYIYIYYIYICIYTQNVLQMAVCRTWVFMYVAQRLHIHRRSQKTILGVDLGTEVVYGASK